MSHCSAGATMCHVLQVTLHMSVENVETVALIAEEVDVAFVVVLGDVVAQLIELRPRPQNPMDSMIRGSNPIRSTRKICESFSESKCCADSSSVCPTPPHHPCVYTHT